MNTAPIALFAYDRLNHLTKTVESLLLDPLASKSDIYIFSDGAKSKANLQSVLKVRAFLKNLVGFKSITIVYRDKNFGLAQSIFQGVSKIISDHGVVIVIEDDLQIRPGFLRFMNNALDHYKNEQDVYQVSGYMFPGSYNPDLDSLFLPITSCWGWATWERAWKCFNFNLDDFESLSKNEELKFKFNINGSYDYLSMANQQKVGIINSWGICWYYNVFRKNGLILYPRESFVKNIGVDFSGTHGEGHAVLQGDFKKNNFYEAEIKFPDKVMVDKEGYYEVSRQLKSLSYQVKTNLRSLIKKGIKFISLIK